jgi:hypothetical protein
VKDAFAADCVSDLERGCRCVKALSQEVVNNTLRLLNVFSALVLALLPAQASLEGIQGWELHPTPRGPRLASWMQE